ncbi:MAG: hypothetical protein KA954_01305 [Chitinophagales bacterium]|nr:hypothetical protein [Chitinophagales bacterium]MBP9845829.1 hypothetical protein [Saprospiraceae bacterium]
MKNLIIVFFVLISFGSYAQYDSTRTLQVISSNGNDYLRSLKIRGGLIIPTDTPKIAVRDSGAIAYKNGLLYKWSGLSWSAVGGGSGVDSTALHTVNSLNDSTFTICNLFGECDTIVIAGTDTSSLHDRIVANTAAIANNTSNIALKLNISDTANKWVRLITKNTAGDSLVYYIGSTRYAVKDSVGTGGASGWGLTGNPSTTAGTNFVGTTDAVDFVIKSNGNELIRAKSNGKVFIDSLQVGAGIGVNYNNVAIGDSVLQRNTTGSGNTAVGDSSLQQNTTASENTAFGKKALRAVATGGGNTAIGSEAGLALTSVANTAVGNNALRAAAGNFNTAVGYSALFANTAADNTAIGVSSLQANTSGTANVGVGVNSLATNTTSSSNTAIGYYSLRFATGGNNTALGSSSGGTLTTGAGNLFIGTSTGNGITTGSYSLVIGAQSSALPASRSNWVIINDGQGNGAFTRDSLNRVGLGSITTPTALLHVAAGTTTIAPLKLTSGTNLTTPEAGALEYNGTNLFFTPSSAARNNVLITASVNTVSPTSPDRTITVVINGTTYYLAAKTTND